jgi:hypothetical protein
MARRTLMEGLNREDGHGIPLLGGLLAAAGTVALGIGAANDTGWLAVVGGIVAAVGILATIVIQHVTIDYGMYGRLEALEKDKQ